MADNVFISHIHEDDARLSDLKDLLAANGYEVRDASINSLNPNNARSPEYIKSEILGPRIQWAGTLIVYVSPETCTSDWVDWEIEYAHRIGKRIVGVWGYGHNECELPDALKKYGDAMVGWRGDRIVEAITGTGQWEDASGNEMPERLVPRHSCV